MITALIIGFVGSFHCVGMCSPIIIAMNKGAGNWKTFGAYHVSRILVYMVFGLFIGMLGAGFSAYEFQQSTSIIAGLMIIIVYGFPKWRNRLEGVYYKSEFYNKLKRFFLPFYQSQYRWLAAGVLNGLLPCGLIYLALAGAMLQRGLLESVLYMMVFGLGTLPALGLISLFRKKVGLILKQFPKVANSLPMSVGLIMVLRGILIQSPDFNKLITAQVMNAMSYCGF